jgi:phosphatidylethanolamine-binding protein (PEBP) family uncharacterized protein
MFAAMRLLAPAHRALPAAAVLAALVVGCGSSGRDLRAPNRDAVYPTRSTAAPQASTQAPTPAQLVSDDFAPGATIPADHGCGATPPGLRWSGIPNGTAEVALGLVDFDENDSTKKVRWLVRGLAGDNGVLPAGAPLPAGGQTLLNGDGQVAYAGPCPPSGKTHTYNFMVFALKEPSEVTPATPAAEALASLQANAGNDIAYYTGLAAGG